MALAGVATIWLTWAWVKRIAGTRAAVIATALLATDTLFLLTGIFRLGSGRTAALASDGRPCVLATMDRDRLAAMAGFRFFPVGPRHVG